MSFSGKSLVLPSRFLPGEDSPWIPDRFAPEVLEEPVTGWREERCPVEEPEVFLPRLGDLLWEPEPAGRDAMPGVNGFRSRREPADAGEGGVAKLGRLSLPLLGAMAVSVVFVGCLFRGAMESSRYALATPQLVPVAGEASPADDLVRYREGRLEILRLEDRVVARRERSALDQLQRMSERYDPADRLFVAVQGSLVRIQQSFAAGGTESAEVLDAILGEELKVTESGAAEVLTDWMERPERRRRAAYLLSEAKSRPGSATLLALFQAVQKDPDLDVAWEAFRAFRKLTAYPGSNFLDQGAIGAWWQHHAPSLLGSAAEERTNLMVSLAGP